MGGMIMVVNYFVVWERSNFKLGMYDYMILVIEGYGSSGFFVIIVREVGVEGVFYFNEFDLRRDNN